MQWGLRPSRPVRAFSQTFIRATSLLQHELQNPDLLTKLVNESRGHKSNPAQKDFNKFQARESDGELS